MNRSLEIDKLVFDVEKQISSESELVKGCKESIADQKLFVEDFQRKIDSEMLGL